MELYNEDGTLNENGMLVREEIVNLNTPYIVQMIENGCKAQDLAHIYSVQMNYVLATQMAKRNCHRTFKEAIKQKP